MSIDEPQKEGKGWRALYGQYPIRISLFIALIGFALFLLQMNTTNRAARPEQVFTLLLVQDFSARNDFLADLPEDAEINAAEVPGIDSHYNGEPLPGFDERFAAFRESLPESPSVLSLPVHLRRSPVESSRLQIPLAYIILQMEPESAWLLLGESGAGLRLEPGKQFLGPHPYAVPPSNQQLQITGGGPFEQTPTLLPDDADALLGVVVQIVEKVDTNAFVLIPAGNTSVGDYAVDVNEFSQELATEYRQAVSQGETPVMVPSFRFSDIRHDTLTYLGVLIGQLLVMTGGFLLCFHFIVSYGRKEHENAGFIKRLIVDTCRLMDGHKRLYALTVLFFMLFWGYGMVNAHLNPAAQEEMVTAYQTIFSGSSWPLGFTSQAYQRGDILTATVMTFVVNFFWGTVVILSLFSVIPVGSAFIINALRGQTIGLALAPAKAFFGLSLVPHLITVVVELQAYLIAGFVSVLLPLALIRPQRFGCDSVSQAFKKYLLWQFKVLPLIAIILAGAALYEALELIVLGNLF